MAVQLHMTVGGRVKKFQNRGLTCVIVVNFNKINYKNSSDMGVHIYYLMWIDQQWQQW